MRCVNCQLRMYRLRRHLLSDESAEVVERVQRWVYPRDVTEDDVICSSCWQLINHNPNEDPEHNNRQQLGHRKVCAGCGRSVLRLKSKLVVRPEMSERDIHIGNIVSEWIRPRQLTNNDEICVACYLRASRRCVPATFSVGGSTQPVFSQQMEQVVEVISSPSGHILNEPTANQALPTTQASDTIEIEESPAQVDSETDAENVPETLSNPAQVDSETDAEDVPGTLSVRTSPAQVDSETDAEDVPGTLSSPAQVDSETDAEDVPGTLSNPAQVDLETDADDVPGTLSVRTSPVQVDSETDAEDVPGTLSSPAQVDSETDAEDIPGTLSVRTSPAQVDSETAVEDMPRTLSVRKEELEEETTNENKMKLFCPKCHTEVSHIAKVIEEDLSKILIAKVYHYFEQEYEELKKFYGDLDLTPLSKFYLRTALATGVSETTLLQILKEEEGRNADRRWEPPKKRRTARKRRRQTDSSCKEDGPDDNVDDIEQPSHADDEEPEIFLKTEEQLQPGSCELNKAQLQTDQYYVELKTEPHTDDEMDTSNETLAHNQPVNTKRKRRKNNRKSDDTPTLEEPEIFLPTEEQLQPGSCELNKGHLQTDPLYVELKTEPHTDDEEDTSNETLAHNQRVKTKRKRRRNTRKNDDTPTLQHTHGEASNPGTSRHVPLPEALDKSCLTVEREIKIEETDEEGFS